MTDIQNTKVKLSSQADAAKWNGIKEIARKEGRNIDSVLDEALGDYIEKKQGMRPRDSVMNAYNSSHSKYDDLYKLLAE